jgi:hypothetical protein
MRLILAPKSIEGIKEKLQTRGWKIGQKYSENHEKEKWSRQLGDEIHAQRSAILRESNIYKVWKPPQLPFTLWRIGGISHFLSSPLLHQEYLRVRDHGSLPLDELSSRRSVGATIQLVMHRCRESSRSWLPPPCGHLGSKLDGTSCVGVLSPCAQLGIRSSVERRWPLGFQVVVCRRVLIMPLAPPLYL